MQPAFSLQTQITPQGTIEIKNIAIPSGTVVNVDISVIPENIPIKRLSSEAKQRARQYFENMNLDFSDFHFDREQANER
jgi:hypothetical protein